MATQFWEGYLNSLAIRGYTPQTFVSDHTNASVGMKATLMRTYDDLRQVEHELKEENARLRIENETLNFIIDLMCKVRHLTRRQLFVLNHMQRMEGEKGWILAFLSPSVVNFLDEYALDEFLEEDIRFFYDATDDE